MIDWHCHALPAMDDGCRDTAESVAVFGMLAAQGVDIVAATPHFRAGAESVGSFLSRRERAWDALRAALPAGSPAVRLGAEVGYYRGVSRLPDLGSLRIEGSGLLLLEMPGTAWTGYTLTELAELSGRTGFRIVLAHVERYLDLQRRDVWDGLLDQGILMQANAGFLASRSTRRRAVSLLKAGRIHLIGSDSHNATSRPPRIGEAFGTIRRKLGEDYANQMCAYGYSLLRASDNKQSPILRKGWN